MIQQMQVKIFKALAHPIRVKIIQKLSNGTLCVCELNEDIEFSQANLSQHLKILRDCHIIGSRKEGLKVFYFIEDAKILEILEISNDMVQESIRQMTSSLD